jgi:hypothetical protein
MKTMLSKYVTLNDAPYGLVICCRSAATERLLEAQRSEAETEAVGDVARMLTSHEQGDFLTILTKLLNSR